ncbi:MAG: radical SAM protein [Verrucomicrobia bacterium]|nr:radical SAM protein [Verrucomicrobiota bacterium]
MRKSFQDDIAILKKLNLPRIWNGIKVLLSFYWSKWTNAPKTWGSPIAFAIEPTTACNLACPECPSGLRSFSRPTGNLKKEVYEKAIDELSKNALYLSFYFQGEPYINPNFLDMVSYARSKKMHTSSSTNAHFLNDENAKKTVESGLDRLIISIDGTSQEVYEQYRVGGKLEKVIEGTKNIVKWKKMLNSKSPLLIFQFLVVKPNEHQMQEVQALADELGVDELRFKTAQVYDYKKGNPLIPDNEQYSRYRKQHDGTYEIKNKLDNHCWKMWHSCVITWDGKVIPCCFDKDAQFVMGNVVEQSFNTIWESDKYKSFRSQLFKGRDQIEICKNCSEGTKVWA